MPLELDSSKNRAAVGGSRLKLAAWRVQPCETPRDQLNTRNVNSASVPRDSAPRLTFTLQPTPRTLPWID